MAPEQVASEGGLDYSLKVDTWGLGVIAYELLHDKMPFRLGFVKFLLSQRFSLRANYFRTPQ